MSTQSQLFFDAALLESLAPSESQQRYDETTMHMFKEEYDDQTSRRRSTLILGESVFDKFVPSKQDFMSYLEADTAVAAAEGADSTATTAVAPVATSVDSPVVHIGTVSPLEIHSVLMESIFDEAESLQNTPMFDDLEVDETKGWTSLFSESEIAASTTETVEVPSLKRPLESSPLLLTPSATPLLDEPLKKRSKSSTSVLETLHSVDHLGVVSYNRKQRAAPLTPIVADESDPVASKRARNTEAARRSRARKMERMSQLEDKVESLLKRNTELEDEVARLRAMLGHS